MGGCDIGATVISCMLAILEGIKGVTGGRNARGEISSFPCQHGYVDVIAPGNLAHYACEAVVEVLGQGIELFGEIQGYDGDFPAGFERDLVVGGGHAGLLKLIFGSD